MVDRQRGGRERDYINFRLLKRYKDKVFLCKGIPLEARMNLSLSLSLCLSLSLSLSRRDGDTNRHTERQSDRQTDNQID